MSHTAQLVARIKALAEKQGRSPTTLSFQLLGNGRILGDLENGKTITLAKYERVLPVLSELEAAAADRPEAA